MTTLPTPRYVTGLDLAPGRARPVFHRARKPRKPRQGFLRSLADRRRDAWLRSLLLAFGLATAAALLYVGGAAGPFVRLARWYANP